MSDRERETLFHNYQQRNIKVLTYDSAVNPSSLILKVRIERTHDDTSVGRHDVMQLNEVSAIQCDQSAPLIDGKRKHFGIGDFLVCSARLNRRRYVVPKPTQCFDRW